MSVKSFFNVISKLNWKTIFFNLKYFPLNIALKSPVFINKNCCLKETNGKIELNIKKIGPGIIKIGYGDVGIFDKKRSRTIWQVGGKIIFNGFAEFGHGCKISVGKEGILNIGNNFNITAESSIVCHKEINIGTGTLISWEVLIMDTDFHKILNKNLTQDNPPQKIQIGNKVWIGCRSHIQKGSAIPDNCVIAANSNVMSKFTEPNYIYGGNPAKMIKSIATWKD